MNMLQELGQHAKSAKYELQKLSTQEKNKALLAVADALVLESGRIIEQNATSAHDISSDHDISA